MTEPTTDHGQLTTDKGGTRAGDARRRAFGQLASVVIVVVAISVYVQLAPRRGVTPAPVAQVAADQTAPATADVADSTSATIAVAASASRPARCLKA